VFKRAEIGRLACQRLSVTQEKHHEMRPTYLDIVASCPLRTVPGISDIRMIQQMSELRVQTKPHYATQERLIYQVKADVVDGREFRSSLTQSMIPSHDTSSLQAYWTAMQAASTLPRLPAEGLTAAGPKSEGFRELRS